MIFALRARPSTFARDRSVVGRLVTAVLVALSTLVLGASTPAAAASPTVVTIGDGAFVWAVGAHPDGSRVYVSSTSLGTVTVIDTETDTVAKSVRVGNIPYALAVAPEGDRVYVANGASASVSVIDTATDTVVDTVPIGGRPIGVAVTATAVYVVDDAQDRVQVIQRSTNTVIASIPVGNLPYGAALAPFGSTLYIGNRLGASISVIDTATNSVTDTVALPSGSYPYGMAATVSSVYVSDLNQGSFEIIDTATKSLTSVPTGLSTTAAAVSSDGKRAFVTQSDGSVLAIDTLTNSLRSTTYSGRGRSYGVAQAADRLYVGDGDNGAVSVHALSSFAPQSQSVAGAAGAAITPTAELVPADFDETPTYTVSPALPTGLELDAESGVISGTPTTAQAAATYTITASDSATSAKGTVSIAVSAVVAPASQVVSGSPETAIAPTAAPTTTGFPGSVTYTVSPALPDGLSLDADTGVVTGTPTATQGATNYTITASDGTFSATSSLSISVSALAPVSQSLVATHGQAIEPTDALNPSGGFDGAVTYSVSPALPAGLSLDTETGVIGGTPTAAAQAATTYTITGTGEVAGTAIATVEISIAPTLAWTDTSIQGSVGAPLTATLPPTVDGFAGTPTFSVSPALPGGLSLDPTTGIISGTPTSAIESATYSVTASDGASSASRDVVVQIAGVTPAAQIVAGTRGTAISTTAPLTAVGFTGAVTYTVGPSLPAGLSLDAATGVVSGTPTGRAQAATNYIVSGSGATAGSATASISIAVAAVAPGSVTGVVATPRTEQATVSWTAPSDDGGTSPVTYSVTASTGGAPCITTDTSCVLTGLAPGSTTFTVVGSTAGGSSPGATSGAVTITAKPVLVTDTTLTPSISGSPREGHTLTAHAAGAADASHQWRADGRRIKGATKATLRLGKAQAGRRITVTVSSGPVKATSPPTRIVSSKRSRIVLSDYSIGRGDRFDVTATGLKPRQRVRIWLGGRRVSVGRADSSGTVDRPVAFPASIEPGIRRVRVSGYDRHDVRTSTVRTTVRYRAK